AELEFLKPLPIFQGIPEKAREKVIEKVRKYLHVVTYQPGDIVMRQGEYGDSAFYIVNGAAELLFKREDVDERKAPPRVKGGAHIPPGKRGERAGADAMLGRGGGSHTVVLSAFPAELAPGGRTILEQGELFGEMSAMSRYPISATVRAETPLRLLQMRLPGLRMLSASSKEFKAFLDTRYRERTLARHLKSVELFSRADDTFIERIQKKAVLKSFGPGQIIAQEGTPADSFLLVRGGYVKVSVATGTSDLAVTYLRTGDFAGEAALLLDESWPFTLQALEHVEVVQIAKDDFKEIASGPGIEDQLWASMLERLKQRGAVARNPVSSEYLQMAMDTGLIHGESVFLIDLTTCTRCDECVRGCADAHGGQPKFIREGERYRNFLIPTACYQCTDPVCMMDCPTGAITRGVGTLEVTINEPTCIGCGNCATRCPWGNITMRETEEKRPDGKPVELAAKCDLCMGRPEGPACVQMCPHGSASRISFKDLEKVTSTLR
ncbi:MAG TPA: cyclic nucleotide-binding domain-containing protein, partial [Vicinamibacteria bacterium]|nr:cyclic nucleotide-binding domain-containing protein [Vicinamibacteria bacterium]